MKKIAIALLLVGFTAGIASAAPSYIARDGQRGYNVTYNYTDKPKNDWYLTLRAAVSFLNWENKYNSDYPYVDVNFDTDKYSFEPVFGGSVAVGKKFGHFWRGEVEAGYAGMFTDKDSGFEFSLQVPYLMANAIYDFSNGLYLGGGLGAAFPIVALDSDIFLPGNSGKTGVSPMAGLMIGYTHKLDDNFVLDLRYRIAGFSGLKFTRHFEDVSDNVYYLDTKIGLVLDNSFSVGIRYEF